MHEPLHRVHQSLALAIVREAEDGIDKQLILIDDGQRRAPVGKAFAILIYGHDLNLWAPGGDRRRRGRLDRWYGR